jgi:FKBP-type peptidyl-prolyl cis-trans isomerase (trigger factor)
MKIEKNILEQSIVELIVEESVENVAKHRKKALAYMQDNADIQGFRKGTKIPENIIIRKYGEDHIAKMTIDFAIDDIYRKALTTEKLMPVAQ